MYSHLRYNSFYVKEQSLLWPSLTCQLPITVFKPFSLSFISSWDPNILSSFTAKSNLLATISIIIIISVQKKVKRDEYKQGLTSPDCITKAAWLWEADTWTTCAGDGKLIRVNVTHCLVSGP